MTDKIIGLVFAVIALVLEIASSIKNPTVESITASIFAVLLVLTIFKLIRNEHR